eukprot:1765805-Rhodomonas_salina.3
MLVRGCELTNHDLVCSRRGCRVRLGLVVAYARSVPDFAQHHARGQYRTSHRQIAAYATPVPYIA